MSSGYLSTHVLDTFRGRAGAGMRFRLLADDGSELGSGETNADGRTDAPLLAGDAFQPGTYELHFDVGAYFAGVAGAPEPGFLGLVKLRFSIVSDEHYHVPLVVGPWTYTTYRGS